MRHTAIVAIGLLTLIWLAAPVGGSQTDERLDIIFDRIQTTVDNAKAEALTQLIWDIWHQSDNVVVNDLMSKGIEEMSVRNFKAALTAFDKMVEVDPDFAEGWNKRATVYYLMGKYRASMRDIERTLTLEPRHFGALSGLGLILMDIGNDGAALKAFEAALKINPHMPNLRTHVKDLRQRLRSKSF